MGLCASSSAPGSGTPKGSDGGEPDTIARAQSSAQLGFNHSLISEYENVKHVSPASSARKLATISGSPSAASIPGSVRHVNSVDMQEDPAAEALANVAESLRGAAATSGGNKDQRGFTVEENAATDEWASRSSTALQSSPSEGGKGGGDEGTGESCYELAGGGHVVPTSFGLIQVGIPPETIKDSMNLGAEVPTNFVIMGDLFDRIEGLSLAEFEFPSYFNFFVKKKRVNIIW